MTWSPEYAPIAALVSERTGLSMPQERRSALATAIPQRMRRVGEADVARYADLLRRDEVALEELAADVTVGETYFFRDPAQFALLRERILPELAGRADADTIRVWSAGCASGEEAYSLAILMHDAQLAARAHIIGTDIARSRLQRAHAARYGRWSLRSVSDDVIRRCFNRYRQHYELKPEYRVPTEFRYLNLAEDKFPSLSTGIWGFDIVLCRNVLIYFEPTVVDRILTALVGALAEGGWLLLGAADPRGPALQGCEVLTTPAGLVYRKRIAAAALAPQAEMPTAAETQLRTAPAPRLPATRTTSVAKAPRRAAAVPATTVAAPDRSRWLQEIRALANRGELIGAERTCMTALEQHAADAELYYLHSILLAERGHHEAAARAARQALYLEPDFVVAHLALGNAYARSERYSHAARAFQNAERLLARMPSDAHVPAAEGEPAGRLLSMARAQMRLANAGGVS